MKKTAYQKSEELFYLLRRNKISDIQNLLESKDNYNVNCKNNQGESLLMLAVKYGQLDAIKLLNQYNIDYNMVNAFGDNAFHYAISHPYHSSEDMEKENKVEFYLNIASLILDMAQYSDITLKEDRIVDILKDKVFILIENYKEKQAILSSLSSQEYFDIKHEKTTIKKVKI